MTDNSCPLPKYSSLSRKRKSKPLVRVGKLGIVRLTGKAMQKLRDECWRRDLGRCRGCGILVDPFLDPMFGNSYHMAHIRNKRMYGDTLENVRALCGECHRAEHGNPTEHTKGLRG